MRAHHLDWPWRRDPLLSALNFAPAISLAPPCPVPFSSCSQFMPNPRPPARSFSSPRPWPRPRPHSSAKPFWPARIELIWLQYGRRRRIPPTEGRTRVRAVEDEREPSLKRSTLPSTAFPRSASLALVDFSSYPSVVVGAFFRSWHHSITMLFRSKFPVILIGLAA